MIHVSHDVSRLRPVIIITPVCPRHCSNILTFDCQGSNLAFWLMKLDNADPDISSPFVAFFPGLQRKAFGVTNPCASPVEWYQTVTRGCYNPGTFSRRFCTLQPFFTMMKHIYSPSWRQSNIAWPVAFTVDLWFSYCEHIACMFSTWICAQRVNESCRCRKGVSLELSTNTTCCIEIKLSMFPGRAWCHWICCQKWRRTADS